MVNAGNIAKIVQVVAAQHFPFAAGVHMPHFEHGPSVRTVILINKSTYYLGNEREVGRLGFSTKGNTNIDISKTCFDKICRNKLRR